MTFTVEYQREEDGRWLAEVVELPGALAYSATFDEAIAKAQARWRTDLTMVKPLANL